MKNHILRLGGLTLACLLLSSIASSAPAGTSATTPGPVYDKQSGLAAGWRSMTWGDVYVEPSRTVSKEGGKGSLLVSAGAGAAPYAGLQLDADSAGGFELDEQLRTEGVVLLSLRNGNDAEGRPIHDQELQVMLSFEPDGGKVLVGRYERVVLSSATTDGKGPPAWQTVTVSIPGMLRDRVDTATPVRLHGVYIQYIDQPQAGFHVGECVIRRTAK